MSDVPNYYSKVLAQFSSKTTQSTNAVSILVFHISDAPFLQFWTVSKTRMCEISQRTKAKRNPEHGVGLLCDTMGASLSENLLHLRNLAKNMEKQCRVEHDELLQEFTRLTTDQEGLAGVLEEIMCELRSDAQHKQAAHRDAKKLLCLLIQVQNYS